MEYNRMLCWVRSQEKKELEKAVKNQFPLTFTENYEDFKKEITDKSYLAISLYIAQNNLEFIRNLLQKIPNKIHIVFDQKYFSNEVLELFTEEDKRCDHYSVKHLIEDFQMKAIKKED